MKDEAKDLFIVRATTAEGDNYIITIGNKRASNLEFKSAKAAQQYIDSKPYELILSLYFAANEAIAVAQKATKAEKTEQMSNESKTE